MKNATKVRAAGALAAGIALAVVGLGGISTATAGLGGGADATIRIVQTDAQKLAFKGPESVDRGDSLRVVNKTNPEQVGPHTFSLVRHHTYPSKGEYKDCGKLEPGTICREIAEWHNVFGEPQFVVDVKKPGWDKMGDFQEEGDSWFTESEGDSDTREVTHGRKGNLVFICAVHPDMKGVVAVNQPLPERQ